MMAILLEAPPYFMLVLGVLCASGFDFPYEEFYGLSPGYDVEIAENITHNHLCLGSFADRSCCYCDEVCLHFKDCCVDRYWNETWSDLRSYLDFLATTTSESKVTNCQPVVKSLADGDRSEEILMVNSCKTGLQTAASEALCTSSAAAHMPVLGSDLYVYKNPSCAMCNGVELFKLLNITAECKVRLSGSSESFPTFAQCTYLAAVRDEVSHYVRRCSSKNPAIKTCPDLKNSNIAVGVSYVGIVRGVNGARYQNLHFLKCNNLPSSGFTVPECEDSIPEISPVRFSLLISFGSEVSVLAREGNREIGSEQPKCSYDEVYDIIRRECQQFICGMGYKKVNSMCVKDNSVVPTTKTPDNGEIVVPDKLFNYCLLRQDASLVIEARLPHASNTSSTLFTFLREQVDKDVSLLHPPFATLTKEIAWNKTSSLSTKLQTFLTSIQSFPSELAEVANVYLLSVMPTTTQLYGADLRHVFPGHRTCARIVEHNLSNATLDEKCSLQIANKTYQVQEFTMHSKYDPRSAHLQAAYYVTCNEFHTEKSCAMTLYTNYTLHQNLSVTVLDKNVKQLLTFEQYVPLEKGIGVCVTTEDKVKVTSWTDTIADVELYLTMGCAIISAICYIITSLTYCAFRDLRTVPGNNIVALCLSLFVSDALVLSTVAVHTMPSACRNVAILLHWVLLAVMAWSTVISFEIWTTVHLNVVRHASSSRKRFLLYFLYASIIPTIIVLIAVALNESKELVMGYGVQGVCWIASRTGRIILYIVPFVVSWTFNFGVLLSTILLVYRQQKKSTKLLTKIEKHDINLAWTASKLIVLLGAVELVGFIQVSGSTEAAEIVNAVFAIAYTLLRGLRGLLIALMYVVFDRKVRSLYRKSPFPPTISFGSMTVTSRTLSVRKENAVVAEFYKNTDVPEVQV